MQHCGVSEALFLWISTAPRRVLSTMLLASGFKTLASLAAVRALVSAVSTSLCRHAQVPPTAGGLAVEGMYVMLDFDTRALVCVASASAASEKPRARLHQTDN